MHFARVNFCLSLVVCGFLFLGNAVAQEVKPEMKISDEAREIQASGMLFDGHNDLPWAVKRLGGTFDHVDISKPTELHTDISRLRAGGLKAQFWSVYVPAGTDLTGNALLQTLEQIQIVHDMCERYPDDFEMADTVADVKRIVSEGKIASMIGVEGGHCIQNSLQVLRMLYEKGARYMTLTHSKTLAWADSCSDKPKNNGLSPFGKEVIREMNRLGMLVDLSHVSIKCMKDALEVTKAPVIFSHSSARAISDHVRNVPDDVLKMTAENGGVVMVNFYSGFIVPADQLQKNKNARGSYKTICDHIEHIIKIAGIDHVGIGSDYDGVGRLPVGLDDVSYYPNITQELLNRGYDKSQIHKILGGNVMRVLGAAEMVAKELKSGRLTFAETKYVATEMFRIKVSAGEFDRKNAVVKTLITMPLQVRAAPLTSVTLSDPHGNHLIGQLTHQPIPPNGDKFQVIYELQFVLPKLAKGQTVELTAVESGLSTNRVFEWNGDTEFQSELKYADQPLVKYMFEPLDDSSDLRRGETYKVYHHVYTPDGSRLITKGPGGLFPHHRGIYFGFNRISYNGKQADVWHCNHGESQSHEKNLLKMGGPVFGRDVNEISWRGRDGEPFATEIRDITYRKIGNSTLVEFHSTITNVTEHAIDFKGDPQHAGVQFRASQDVPDYTRHLTYYVRPDGKGKPGEFRNWSNKKDETKVNLAHINLPWNAVSFALPQDAETADGKLDESQVNRFTVCYLDSPGNPKPSRYSERDYARFGSYFETTLKPDESFSVDYRFWIQEGEMSVEEVDALSSDFVHPVSVEQISKE